MRKYEDILYKNDGKLDACEAILDALVTETQHYIEHNVKYDDRMTGEALEKCLPVLFSTISNINQMKDILWQRTTESNTI